MRSLLRSLTFGVAANIAGATMAQQPFTLVLNGVVTNCYTGQTVNVQTVQGTQPSWNIDVPVDPNTCTWSATLAIASNPAWYAVSTQCNGAFVSMSDSTGFGAGDSTYVNIVLTCGAPDCLGNPGGGALPGTVCTYTPDSGNTWLTGMWGANCVCGPDSGGFVFDCLGTFNGSALPGTFCVWNNQPGSWSTDCVCTPDSGNVYDCLWVLNGTNMPGTSCVNFFGDSGTWSMNCFCDTTLLNYDCLGILDGPNLPNTPCDDNNPNTLGDLWNAVCVCIGVPDSTNTGDCLGNPGGGALPGTPCVVPGTILLGTWSADCICEANNPVPCQADFWVVQAYGSDSLPVPYEVWVWNLSGGGTGIYTYNWSFGDGTTSTDAYPTHVYDGNGPYALCLTIADSDGCTSTHCDTISIDGDGFFGGFHSGGGDRQDGFTLNVRNPSAVTSINEWNAGVEIAAWPNPAKDVLNLAIVNGARGAVEITIHDLRGQVVLRERHTLTGVRDQLSIPTETLVAGLYLLRCGNENGSTSIRFVKAD